METMFVYYSCVYFGWNIILGCDFWKARMGDIRDSDNGFFL